MWPAVVEKGCSCCLASCAVGPALKGTPGRHVDCDMGERGSNTRGIGVSGHLRDRSYNGRYGWLVLRGVNGGNLGEGARGERAFNIRDRAVKRCFPLFLSGTPAPRARPSARDGFNHRPWPGHGWMRL